MYRIIKLSDNSKDYINNYLDILDRMKKAMEDVPLSTSIAEHYIKTILPHHHAEIEMSENILKFTTNPEIEEMAKEYITGAKENIATLQQLLIDCGQEENDVRVLNIYKKGYDEVFNKMIMQMSSAPTGNNLNIDFLCEMIPHHEGAIGLSANLLRFDVNDKLKGFATEMINKQSSQVRRMQTLLNKLQKEGY